jgi:hypothetical protein
MPPHPGWVRNYFKESNLLWRAAWIPGHFAKVSKEGRNR